MFLRGEKWLVRFLQNTDHLFAVNNVDGQPLYVVKLCMRFQEHSSAGHALRGRGFLLYIFGRCVSRTSG
jgi:hypothetical protein